MARYPLFLSSLTQREHATKSCILPLCHTLSSPSYREHQSRVRSNTIYYNFKVLAWMRTDFVGIEEIYRTMDFKLPGHEKLDARCPGDWAAPIPISARVINFLQKLLGCLQYTKLIKYLLQSWMSFWFPILNIIRYIWYQTIFYCRNDRSFWQRPSSLKMQHVHTNCLWEGEPTEKEVKGQIENSWLIIWSVRNVRGSYGQTNLYL